MNKGALKKFATEARRELREKVRVKAYQLGITEEKIKKESLQSSDAVFVDGRQLTIEEQSQRNRLITEINNKGFDQVIEEVAYTWFNRFTALRFMEVNNYLPNKVRALSSQDEGSYEPDIIKEALTLDWDIDKELIYELKMSNDNDAIDKLYKYLIIKECNELADILPFMFGKTDDFTKLLFPDGLLSEGSFLRTMTDIDKFPEGDWQDVEIIGWLYQYYIAEENERVIQAKKRYTKEEIPFATQLFTPDWIVRYMVQNALGRYWVESHPGDRELIKDWEFYLENPNPEPDFEEKLAPYINKEMKIEKIKCFDPAMGSGHILVYMFDLLYQIYKKHGFLESEIPRLIIENNLYGLEIDDRAYQLACFAVIMKAQQYYPKFLKSLERQVKETGKYLKLNLASIQETNNFDIKDIEYIAGESRSRSFEKTKAFIEQFENAKIYGSLTEILEFDEAFLIKRAEELVGKGIERAEYQEYQSKVDRMLLDLIKQTKIMNQTYDVLVTNPPYIGSASLHPLLDDCISEKYEDVKYDIFSAFMIYGFNKTKKLGQLGFMTPFVWMFISSYRKLRKIIIEKKTISSLVQLEYSGFDGATVPICTFTLRNYMNYLSGEYVKLSDFKGVENQPIKTIEAVVNPSVKYRYTTKSDNFYKIPGSPIAYWVGEEAKNIFTRGTKLSDITNTRKGMATGLNEEFVRAWFEVNINKIGFELDRNNAKNSERKWFPYANGGQFRKWYGNYIDVVNWEKDGCRLKTEKHESGRIRAVNLNLEYIFKQGLSWTSITSAKFSIRLLPKGFLFSSASNALFSEKDILYYLGLLNSVVHGYLSKAINPTLNANPGDIGRIPIVFSKKINEKYIEDLVSISRTDWDSFETSWDFKRHPLLQFTSLNAPCTVESAFEKWKEFTETQFNQLKANEEELNRIFIEIYSLQDELTSEVEDKDITISKADRERDIKSFVSYAVGCMFGRYSLDEEGLAYAGGEFDPNKYRLFPADKDNVLPIVADSYFEDDIVSRFTEFVQIVFGKETLNENLKFIADSLGVRGDESPKETIRRYFLNDFYKNHVQTYKKRPIYWMFTSGKEKAFNALIYMHRYDSSTLARIRTDYLHVLQSRLQVRKQSLIEKADGAISPREKKNYEKELKDLDKKLLELKEYDEALNHMTNMKIEIDLDDGVAVNYEKFKGLLEKI